MNIKELIKDKKKFSWIIIVCAVLFLFILIWIIIIKSSASTIDTKEGINKLSYMDQIKVNDVEQQIEIMEAAEREAAEAWANRTPNEKFSNSIVMGDSITQGLYEYGILDESHIISDRGAYVSKKGDDKIDTHLEKAIELQPQTIFLSYGMNDLSVSMDDCDAFKEDYKTVIDQLKSNIPNVTIYINSILPVEDFVIEENIYFANISQYNEKLKELCSEEDIVYIDNTDLVKPEYYASDGIHLSPTFYPDWVNHMAEVANL